MDKEELVIKLAEEFGISSIDIYNFVNGVVDSLGSAFEKGKNVNIEQFGRFKVLSRKNENGEVYRFVSFSPVKKFVKDVNYKYNNLETFPIDDSEEELYEDSHETFEGVEILDPDKFVLKEKTGKGSMSDNKKFDENLLRDNFSNEESSQGTGDFNSSQEGNKEVERKDFELPSSIIQLHNDITNEEASNMEKDVAVDVQSKIDNSIDLTEDIDRIVEERKKALDEITSEIRGTDQSERHDEGVEEESIEEMRDKFEEVRNFNDEKNEELHKIISERNKIIDDINKMVNESEVDLTEDKKYEPVKEEPKYEQPKYEEPINVEPPKEEIKAENTEKEEEYFDPIITSDEEDKKQDTTFEKQFEKIETPEMKDIDYAKNDILTPEDTEKFKIEAEDYNKVKDEPQSFEDVFETSGEIKDDAALRENHVPPPPIIEEKPAVKEESMQKQHTSPVTMPPPVKQETYHDRMERRREMYQNESSGGSWKTFGIVGGILAVLVILIYWGYNSNMFNTPPPPPEKNNEQQTENTQPPADNKENQQQNKEQQNKEQPADQQNSQQQKTTENTNTPPLPPSGEEYITDTGMDVVFVRTAEGYFIQTASFKQKSDADKEAKTIKTNGKEVSVKEADLGAKGTYFRVRIGTFKTKEEATEFAKKMN